MPAYSFDATNPLDNSLVSAFPANERAMRLALTNWSALEHANTGRHKLPSGTRAARDALADKVAGMWYLDTDNGLLEVYDGAAWTKSMGVWMPGDLKPCAYDPSSVGPGWLPCDGRSVSTTTYAILFAKIGSVFNTQGGAAAPGAGLFRVPNFQSTTFMGYHAGGDADGDHDTIGEQVGAKSEAIVPATHLPELVVTDPGHTHTRATAANIATGGGTQVLVPSAGATQVSTEVTGVRVNVGGTNTPYDKRQKCVVVGVLIKT